MSRRFFGGTVAVLSCVIDQLSKSVVQQVLAENPQGIRLCPFLNVIEAWNRGVSFSLFASFNSRWILVGLTIVLCVLIVRLMYRSRTTLSVLGYSCILGGALGNLVDRVYFGAVFDFIDVHLYNWHFYTFNGADSFISLGVVFLLWDYLAENWYATRET